MASHIERRKLLARLGGAAPAADVRRAGRLQIVMLASPASELRWERVK